MPLETPPGYRALDERGVAAFLAGLPSIRARLGGSPDVWRVHEVGDGNLNLVFIVEGPDGDVCVKQALPYVRLVGESWPFPLDRAFFEHRASSLHARFAPRLVPEMLHYEPALFLMVMQRLSPHVIMRRGMIDGIVYPRFAEDITDYMAATLFGTSDLAMPAARKRPEVAVFCANIDLCKITEDLIFTDPYMVHERNRWTSPQLDRAAAAIRGDDALKRAVSVLKHKFLTETQALLHGDLHTGSIMVTPDDTRVIDPEFAVFGPIGFDVGKVIGNLLLCWFSQDGHESEPGDRDPYRRWILETVEQVWTGFRRKFLALWDGAREGDAWPPALFEGSAGQQSMRAAQAVFMDRLLADALGFAGAAMIRRTLGLAHNIDFERIADPDRRAACERLNLELARELILEALAIGSIGEVAERARAVRARGPSWTV